MGWNEWLVCSTRDGRLSIMTRWEREAFIAMLMMIYETPSTHVVRSFPNEEEAKLYKANIEYVNKFIEEL